MKNLTLIYCGEDGDAAKSLADSLRDDDNDVAMCSTEYFVGAEIQAARVIIMPDVPLFRTIPIKEAYPKAQVFGDTPVAAVEPKTAMEFFKGAVLTPPMQVAQMQANNNALAEVIPIKRPRGRPRKVAV